MSKIITELWVIKKRSYVKSPLLFFFWLSSLGVRAHTFKYGEVGCPEFEPQLLHIICNIPTNWIKLTRIVTIAIYHKHLWMKIYLAIFWMANVGCYDEKQQTVLLLTCYYHFAHGWFSISPNYPCMESYLDYRQIS